jgi:hypothetical protein
VSRKGASGLEKCVDCVGSGNFVVYKCNNGMAGNFKGSVQSLSKAYAVIENPVNDYGSSDSIVK